MSELQDSLEAQKYGHRALFQECSYKVLVWYFVVVFFFSKEVSSKIHVK